jgi:hypothetical protein
MIVEHINQNTGADWGTCVLRGRRGIVPMNYVELLDESEAAAHLAALSFA